MKSLIEEKPRQPRMRGQQLFFGKARSAECHTAPYYTDNLMHNLQAERFYGPQKTNGMMAFADGAIKHSHCAAQSEKADVVSFLRAL
jgi:cytochrome c peroxidase